MSFPQLLHQRTSVLREALLFATVQSPNWLSSTSNKLSRTVAMRRLVRPQMLVKDHQDLRLPTLGAQVRESLLLYSGGRSRFRKRRARTPARFMTCTAVLDPGDREAADNRLAHRNPVMSTRMTALSTTTDPSMKVTSKCWATTAAALLLWPDLHVVPPAVSTSPRSVSRSTPMM